MSMLPNHFLVWYTSRGTAPVQNMAAEPWSYYE